MGLSCMALCYDYRTFGLYHVKTLLQFLVVVNNGLNLNQMFSRNKIIILSVLVLALLLVTQGELLAQCPMCKMSAEQNLKDGGTAGKGLNKGILYMLTIPYMLVGGLGFLWWKNRRKLSDEIYDQPYSEN